MRWAARKKKPPNWRLFSYKTRCVGKDGGESVNTAGVQFEAVPMDLTLCDA